MMEDVVLEQAPLLQAENPACRAELLHHRVFTLDYCSLLKLGRVPVVELSVFGHCKASG